MKIYTTKQMFRGLAVALALAVPGISLASDHILIVKTNADVSVTGTNGVVTSGGVVTTPITITDAAVNSGNSVTYGTGQTLNIQTLNVKMCKRGTKTATSPTGQLEWLDQGPTIIGATGTLTDSAVVYSLVLSQTGLVDNYASSTGLCPTEGALSYSVTRTAVIQGATTALFTGKFDFGNVMGSGAGGVPEPGTLSLMGLGLAGLGWMGTRRARKARAIAI